MNKKMVAFIIGLLLCAAGLGAWIYQIMNGLQITDMNNLFSWGLYMGTFEFYIGLCSGGMIFFSIIYLFGLKKLEYFGRIACVSSFMAVIACGCAIMTDLGQPFRVMQMLLTPNFGSPLFWDVVVLGVFAVICVIAMIIQFVPLFKYQDSRISLSKAAQKSRTLSYIALPAVVIMDFVTTLMFSVQNSREWWHSALLPADSIAVGVLLGLSFMMLVVILTTDKAHRKEKAQAVTIMRITAGIAIACHLVFTIIELVTLGWNQGPESQELLHIIFSQYGGLYACEIILPLIAMLIYFKKTNALDSMMLLANLMVIAAMFIHRMMMLLPAFNQIPLTLTSVTTDGSLWEFPIAGGIFEEGQDLFLRGWQYAPTSMEWCVNLLSVGIVIAGISFVLIIVDRCQKKHA